MNEQDAAGRIMAHAFHDELEKIAGLPRALRSGTSSTAYGRARQLSNKQGKTVTEKVKEWGSAYRDRGSKPMPTYEKENALSGAAIEAAQRGRKIADTGRASIGLPKKRIYAEPRMHARDPERYGRSYFKPSRMTKKK